MAAIFRQLRERFVHTPRAIALVFHSSPTFALGLGALTLLAALMPLLVAYTGKIIVDAVVAGARGQALRFVALELALVAFQALVQRGLGLLRALLGARLSVDINVLILEKALTLGLRHFEDTEFYDQLTRARREASSRPLSLVIESFQLLQNLLTLAGYVALLVSFSGLSVLGLIVAAVPATLAEMRFSKAAFRLRNWRSPETRRLSYIEYVLANDEHVKEVRLFGLGPLLLGRYRELGEKFYKEDRALAQRRALWAYGLSLIATFAFYGCYGIMAAAAAAGLLTLGNMTLYIVAFRQGQQAFQSCLSAIGSMYEDNLYMSNLFSYLAIPTDSEERRALPSEAALAKEVSIDRAVSARRGEARGAPSRSGLAAGAALPDEGGREGPPLIEEGIRFENVGFRYPGQERFALRGVSLYIPKGQSLALVGHNGAGKTTFIKLLTRLYKPSEGRVLLDGRDLADWDEGALRRRIGVIFQDFNQYQFTLRENISFGSIEHVEDNPRVERAADRGGALEVVAAQQKGLETQLGRWFKDGVELSGGQWQKIALSRAFMREEADILVLDEPTAALDAEAEHAVFERFQALTKGRTTILISHRFPTVRMADRILVMERGAVQEEGTHAELIARGGRYAQLFALQAKGYL